MEILKFFEHIFTDHREDAFNIIFALLVVAAFFIIVRIFNFVGARDRLEDKQDERASNTTTELIDLFQSLLTPLVTKLDAVLDKLAENSTETLRTVRSNTERIDGNAKNITDIPVKMSEALAPKLERLERAVLKAVADSEHRVTTHISEVALPDYPVNPVSPEVKDESKAPDPFPVSVPAPAAPSRSV